MGIRYVICLALASLLEPSGFGVTGEPDCSRFHYEERLMEKIVRMEIRAETIEKQMEQVSDDNKSVVRQFKDFSNQLQVIKEEISDIRQRKGSSGTTYVRWGRLTCPENSDLVYDGNGANYLCLPKDPLWDIYDDSVQYFATISGGEYETYYSNVFQHLHEADVPCAVCKVSISNVLMIPGRNECYPGWRLEYSGYLMAQYRGFQSKQEYICVDAEAKATTCSSSGNEEGVLLYHVEARCGSLRCPPYVNGRELTCAVCSENV